MATNQNTKLTIIHANNIIVSQINAFFNTFRQLSYHLLSAHDVSIKNHQYRQKHRTMVVNIPKHQLIAFFIVVNRFGLTCLSSVCGSSSWLIKHIDQNQKEQFSLAKTIDGNVNIHSIIPNEDIIIFCIYFFIF